MQRLRRQPIRLRPLPEYPEIILALNIKHNNSTLAGNVEFHWLLWVPDRGATRERLSPGTKMHALGRRLRGNDGAWIHDWGYESTKFTLNTSHTVAAAAILGRLPTGKTVEDLDQLLAVIPMSVPAVDQARERDFTCRVWIREAVRRMHAHRYIHCPNVDALEEEMRRYGMERSNNLTSVTCSSLVSAVNSRAVE
ncbi:uncharacterized protein TRAVEDRAFT_42187 [Trametes versicolor FP-101664 SS1]|uniref:uncharacterized protein n=1 Tax=Trametes versicolor (strain FP-101664) TaxID=717944 RepID=UPI00046219D9|nr:uncharacterized protein TRAVEDRAFT_42187 [Trametes versicolor FP-101664 SS1]EIW64769.1 hypothetical protein TRAVEDRAFT_42187 [Trametes versicolor FP-101664 SS1]